MNKVEFHVKTKYSLDKDSTIDIEALLWNIKENNERGVIFVDKDSIIGFSKIESIYKKLCEVDNNFKSIKIGYGVEVTSIIEDIESNIVIVVKNQNGLNNLYEIMTKYINEYNKRISIDEVLKYKDNLLVGIIANDKMLGVDLSIFDYIEINDKKYISKLKNYKEKLMYSNMPNALSNDEILAKKVLYFHQKIDNKLESRVYKDTKSILKEFDDEDIVIKNSNMIFDNLDRIIINDDKFYITNVDNFNKFEMLVRDSFNIKYRNPSLKNLKRLDEELKLIKELNYTYVYKFLISVSKYIRDEKQYYQLGGFINNSLVAYVLNITEVEPYRLPYELFFSEIPKIEFIVSEKFYYKKLFKFIMNNYKDELVRCNYYFKLNDSNIPRIIKHYEIMKKCNFNSKDKDYICSVLKDIPLFTKTTFSSFYLIPRDMNFIPYIKDNTSIKSTYYDYKDLKNNFVNINFRLNDDIEKINNLINKTNYVVYEYNDGRVFNLFRNTEELECKFNILNRNTGTLNIRHFDDVKLENKLVNIHNIWINDLVKVLVGNNILEDDLYIDLKNRCLEDVDIFNVINSLKESEKILISKSNILNKIKISYTLMYYKLYYPLEYYFETLKDINYNVLNERVYSYKIINIKNRYYKLENSNKDNLCLSEIEEYKLLEILLEMYERNIKYSIVNKKIIVEGTNK